MLGFGIGGGAFTFFLGGGGTGTAVERPRQVASTGDAVLSIMEYNPIFMVGTDEAAGELRILEDAQRALEQRIRS